MKTMLRKLVVIVALVAFAKIANMWGEVDWGIKPGGFNDAMIDRSLIAAGTAFGLLLLCAWLAGRIAKQCGLPMVTGFLLIGIALGPTALGVITQAQQDHQVYQERQ